MQCLLSARYVLKATVLRQGGGAGTVNLSEQGTWEVFQDPVTLEIVRQWVPVTDDNDPSAPQLYSIDCMANGIIDGGIRVAGTTERFDKDYKNIDYVRMFYGTQHTLTKRDRITNIRNKITGQIIWKDEESDMVNGEYRATVFNIDGVTPVVNPFGRHIENFAMLQRAE